MTFLFCPQLSVSVRTHRGFVLTFEQNESRVEVEVVTKLAQVARKVENEIKITIGFLMSLCLYYLYFYFKEHLFLDVFTGQMLIFQKGTFVHPTDNFFPGKVYLLTKTDTSFFSRTVYLLTKQIPVFFQEALSSHRTDL